MKNKRWILIIISVFVFVFTVLGVWWYVNYSVKRTAEGETSFFVDENEDLMVGVYITEEPLKNDNFRYLAEEKEIGEFQFNTDVKGYGCFQYKTDDGEGSFVGSVGDEIFCECGVMFETKSFFLIKSVTLTELCIGWRKMIYIYIPFIKIRTDKFMFLLTLRKMVLFYCGTVTEMTM